MLRVVALVDNWLRKLTGWGCLRLPVGGEGGVHVKAERVFEGIIRKVKLAVQVDPQLKMTCPPRRRPYRRRRGAKMLPFDQEG